MFSHDGHLYRVHATASGARVWVMPRIRRAIPVGTDLLTDPPIFFGRLTEDSAGQVQRELGRFSGAVTLTLEEAWER
ncbi:MAG: hypothetical protein ACPGFC_08985, partial [Paracoccaceae bacterium]